ncbi:MAG: MerR family DNA-binding transcriptional regulator [Sutterella sp.]|nr:MerR family DNA-binding transcriptional regulator [Sutterella sp.]
MDEESNLRGLLRIGVFSQVSGVSIKALRLWDELGLLKPVIVDSESGYRYYRASQLHNVDRLLMVKSLGIPMTRLKAWAQEEGYETFVELTGERYFERVGTELEARRRTLEQAERYLASQRTRYAFECALLAHGEVTKEHAERTYYVLPLKTTTLSDGIDERSVQSGLSQMPERCGRDRIGSDWGIRVTRTPEGTLAVALFIEAMAGTSSHSLSHVTLGPGPFHSVLVESKDPLWALVEREATEYLTREAADLWIHLCSQTQGAKADVKWEFEYREAP